MHPICLFWILACNGVVYWASPHHSDILKAASEGQLPAPFTSGVGEPLHHVMTYTWREPRRVAHQFNGLLLIGSLLRDRKGKRSLVRWLSLHLGLALGTDHGSRITDFTDTQYSVSYHPAVGPHREACSKHETSNKADGDGRDTHAFEKYGCLVRLIVEWFVTVSRQGRAIWAKTANHVPLRRRGGRVCDGDVDPELASTMGNRATALSRAGH
ncbi:hypothetical protein QBC43DRAFT_367503 [Cladorrhinum sp. PSN259]|nr:hypothetical protein QBC43DRAFT_367503 [Cladorrhinum sp. PSN259]